MPPLTVADTEDGGALVLPRERVAEGVGLDCAWPDSALHGRSSGSE